LSGLGAISGTIFLDRLVEIAAMEVRIFRHRGLGIGVGEVLDALIGLEVILDQKHSPPGGDPHEGMEP
jgi:hypothetical protein